MRCLDIYINIEGVECNSRIVGGKVNWMLDVLVLLHREPIESVFRLKITFLIERTPIVD